MERRTSYKADQRKTKRNTEIPKLHETESKRGSTTTPPRGKTTQCAAAVETTRSRVFTRSRTAGRIPQRRPQEGCDTRRHHRRWRRGAELSLESIHTPRPLTQPLAAPKLGIPNTIWELPRPKRRQHQDPPPSAPRHPHDRRDRPPPLPRCPPKSQPRSPPSRAAAPASPQT